MNNKQNNVVPMRTIPNQDSLSSKVAVDTDVRMLIPGGDLIVSPVLFGDDRWNLGGHPSWRSKAGAQTNLDFGKIPARWRSAVKEWALLGIDPSLALKWAPNDPVANTWPEKQEPLKLVTVQGNLKSLRSALNLLDRYDIIEPDDDEWARVATLMRQPQDRAEKRVQASLSPGTLRMRLQQLHSLWSMRTIVDRPTMLGSEPFGGKEGAVIFGVGGRPKLNQRRPHEDVGVCLGMVAWVFDNIADDIVEHLRWWRDNTLSEGEAPVTREQGYQSMVSLMHELVGENGCLPGILNTNKKVTLAHSALGRLLGQDDADEAYLWGRFAMRRFADVPLELFGGNPCPLPIREFPLVDGSGNCTWTERLLYNKDELTWWASALVYYAMYYISATCGLRDLDLDCLALGCVTTESKMRPSGETFEVTTMKGFKQKNRTSPEPTSWKVNARLVKIVRIIEQLHDVQKVTPSINSHTGQQRLFNPQLVPQGRSRDSVHLDLDFMSWLTKGARLLFDRGIMPRHLDDITRISVAQIRITALQAYASRQLGNALVAQFGQWSGRAVGLGYHGDIVKIIHLADPSEAQDLQMQHAGLALVNAAQHIDDFKGNGTLHLKDLINRHGIENDVPLSNARLLSLGKKNQNIVTGPNTLCIYRPEVALCDGKGSANFRLCRPFECRNSVMSKADRAKVELRRRQEMLMAPILQRSAKKISKGMPEIEIEFADMTNEALISIVAADLDDYVAVALNERNNGVQ
jgi:hypothetical protein